MMNKERNVKMLSPFVLWCQKVIPLAFDESMSYYECLCSLYDYVIKLANAVNNNADAVSELQDFVTNYFENLDVQEEINNKLDEMAESGQLTEIVTEYLQIKGILAYNTVNDMKLSDNLVDGSFAKTYGNVNLLDGLGRFYKVRQILNTDVVDEINIIALHDANLIAELIPEKYLNDIGNINNLHTTDKTSLVNAINEIADNNDNGNKYVFIGDSYGELSQQNTWVDVVINNLGLSSSDYARKTESSTGFCNPNSTTNHTFINLLQIVKETLTETERNSITHIVVCGGANDMKPQYSLTDLTSAISQFITYAKNNFINATVYVGMIGFTTDINVKKYLGRVLDAYEKCINYNGVYLNGVQNVSHYYPYFNLTTSDTVHPNQNGSTAIGNGIYEALKHGSVSVMRDWELVSDSVDYNNLYSYSNNDNYKLKLETPFRFNVDSADMILRPENPIHIMSFNGGCVGGIASPTYAIQGTIQIQLSDNTTYKCNGSFKLSSYIYSDGVTIRQRLDFYPHEIDTSTSGVYGFKHITNAQRIFITPTVLDMSIYDC